MTNSQILQTAIQQSAIDSNCNPDDFVSSSNKVVISAAHPNARRYLQLPFYCDLTTYGNNIVASVSEEIADSVKKYIHQYRVEQCFETPYLQVLNDDLKEHGMGICFMAEYFLPDMNRIEPLGCRYATRILEPEEFAAYYQAQWSNALCKERKQLDILAVGAFDKNHLVGLAGCSADCDTMWQIGVDVLPSYRRQGIASAITSQLAVEILQRDIVPFYCCAWSNIKSARNAIRSGFKPAWAQITAKSIEMIASLK